MSWASSLPGFCFKIWLSSADRSSQSRSSADLLIFSGSVLISVQLALARQDEKERKQSDDGRRWPDDSYSPRRHWCSISKPDR
jgi:hypothetical protein